MVTSAERVSSQTKVCLWALGTGAASFPVGATVGDRYEVVAPQIWRDLQPETPPTTPTAIPDTALPYLQAHTHRLHVPGVYDVISEPGEAPILLLENAAINARSGQLYPALTDQWSTASAARQMSWLWQIWQLWEPLQLADTVDSLLSLDNVRVDGWRVRLQQLLPGQEGRDSKDLAQSWQPLLADAQPAIAEPLQNLCEALSAGQLSASQLTIDLNYLLLKESAQYRPRFRLAGATHPGPHQDRNEDACYPEGEQHEIPTPRIAIVCDGVGGHEAGEVASQVVVRSLQLQLQGLLAEAGHEENAVPPAVIAQQIEAAVRVVNDLVNTQNDLQSRSNRQRMGSTLVMTLVVPQRLKTPQGWVQVDELYVAHVGDSRAYWITPDYCHLLTVDDDLAGRNTQAGRAFYSAVRDRPEAGSLTQAIGTRGSYHLTPHVQRFLFHEEGILLLCTDGLSDNRQIENAWANYIGLITKDIITLQSAVDSWIELANQKNGHDNVAVVLMQIKPFLDTAYGATVEESTAETDPEDLTDASKALLYGEEETGPATESATTEGAPKATIPRWWIAIVATSILFFAGLAGWWVAGKVAPSSSPAETESVE